MYIYVGDTTGNTTMSSLPVGHFYNQVKENGHACHLRKKNRECSYHSCSQKVISPECLFSFPDLGQRRIKRDSLSVDE